MAAEETTSSRGNITNNFNAAQGGLNMDQTIAQIAKGKLTYALNAAVENFDSSSINYQNEPGNEPCYNNGDFFPADYSVIGNHFIPEKNKHIFFLANSTTGASQIGYMENNDCTYRVLLADACLAFNINNPIHKVVHRITNCTTEIYWTDGLNPRRYLDIENVPTSDICNKLKIQPNFTIPQLDVVDVVTGGELTAGTYQFAIQYCDALGFGYTSYYSVTNPISIANTQVTTPDFNYSVNKAIRLNISNLETAGYFQYYNLAVIKTVNGVESVELVGTYYIDSVSTQYTYSGQNQTQIKLSLNDIFEKFPYYDVAQDVTSVQDILVWDNLTSNDRINYQSIASQISLKWETYKLPATESYADSINTAELRGYLRDEVYAFEIVFLLKNGKQTDGFHIPGRVAAPADLVAIPNTNPDYIGTGTSAPTWKIYNTASVTGVATGANINNATPYQYGEFAYWESEDEYPANSLVWGSLAGQKIRHHKFPDVLVSPIFESATYSSGQPVMQTGDAVYPIGVRIDTAQVQALIAASSLTAAQKADIAGFKIVRGNRNTHKSIVGKGILRNVGKFNREGTDYYFPNYPYNDLAQDPFLLERSNAYSAQSTYYKLVTGSYATVQYTDSSTGELTSKELTAGTSYLCSVTMPVVLNGATTITDPVAQYNARFYQLTSKTSTNFFYQDPLNYPANTPITVTVDNPVVIASATAPQFTGGDTRYTIALSETVNPYCQPANLNAFSTDESKFRMVFNSPETSFGQPTLGNILKIENALIGAGKAHFVEVKNNARYKFLNRYAQQQALKSSYDLANATGTFDPNAMFTVYQSYLTIYINGITRKNYAYSFNSVASYDYWKDVTNSGNKQRELDLYQYIIPGIQSVADTHDINNFQRESSVYVKTAGSTPLPYVKDVPAVSATGLVDNSRFSITQRDNCGNPEMLEDITSILYYGSLKNIIPNQYGQIYTYQTIDTGFQVDFDALPGLATIFGGDTFISRFAFKTKLPFFIDNRVGAPDDSDIFYDEIGNVAYPKFWHSSRSILSNYTAGTTELANIISVKAVSFDCSQGIVYSGGSGTTTTTTTAAPNSVTKGSTTFAYDGKFYLFAYGIPYFYCESSINTDLRQATNNKEGDFYPHVSSGIPDNWLQQSVVPIAFDNVYNYNTTYSRQNTDNFFSHLPENWSNDQCNTVFPFRAIYSDAQVSDASSKVNNWLIYRPVSFFDFPQSYGNLTSLDGIQNKAVLARFENKSLLYNTMLTINTSNPQAAYLGNDTLFKSAPPIDFAETDLGYVGSQNKMLLKIPEGQITVDAKRGQIFLISGNGATDLTAFGSGVQRFMTDHLAFEILRYFPEVNIDNHFTSVGLHGVYDSKFDRIIITKHDYIPQPDWAKLIYYGTDPAIPLTYKQFYIIDCTLPVVVKLTDPTYFCNKSWTMSFNFNTKSWISFHTYLPNYYIGENNFFYSGLNGGCNMTVVAAVPTSAGCLLPSGSAIINNCSTGVGCMLPSGSAIVVPPSTTTTTSTSSTSTTTSTTTVAPPPTTTTTTTINGTTTTTTTLTPPPSTTTTTTTGAPITTTTTTSSTTQLATVILDPRNSLVGTSYTPYINGSPDPSWDSGSRSYPLGTTISLDYVNPACSVTLNGSPYTSGAVITLTTTGTQTFTLLNADHWVNSGAPYCVGSEQRQGIVNDCGATSYTLISACSCSCDVTCGGTYWGPNTCSGNQLIRTQYYYCNNQPTGVTEVIDPCSCQCNQACAGTYYGTPYCSGNAKVADEYYTCNNAFKQTVTLESCSCDCNVGCGGTYWDETCSGTTLIRVEKYVCNNANTGNTQNISCSATCGASTVQVWTNEGSTYCITGSCTLRQLQRQTNPCAADYNTTRVIDTGTVSSSCGTNYWEYYCVNYGVAPYEYRRREVNTCTGNTGVDQLVSYDATECGYFTPLPSFGISASAGSSGIACTRTIGNVAYCAGGDPYIGNTIHTTDNPSSPVYASGFYHINVAGDEYIQINGSGVVVDRGAC